MTIEEYIAAIRALGLRPSNVPGVWTDRDKIPHNVHIDPKYTPEERSRLYERLKESLFLN
jgi:hypothetical protein